MVVHYPRCDRRCAQSTRLARLHCLGRASLPPKHAQSRSADRPNSGRPCDHVCDEGDRIPVAESAQRAHRRDSILGQTDVASRKAVLTALKSALTAHGVPCVLAGRHRLVLRYSEGSQEPSGPTDPQLHIFTPGGKDVATTDGRVYRLASGQNFPAADPSAAALAITHSQMTQSPT